MRGWNQYLRLIIDWSRRTATNLGPSLPRITFTCRQKKWRVLTWSHSTWQPIEMLSSNHKTDRMMLHLLIMLWCKKSDFLFGGVFCCFWKSTFNHHHSTFPLPGFESLECHVMLWLLHDDGSHWDVWPRDFIVWHWAIPQFYLIPYDEGFPRLMLCCRGVIVIAPGWIIIK